MSETEREEKDRKISEAFEAFLAPRRQARETQGEVDSLRAALAAQRDEATNTLDRVRTIVDEECGLQVGTDEERLSELEAELFRRRQDRDVLAAALASMTAQRDEAVRERDEARRELLTYRLHRMDMRYCEADRPKVAAEISSIVGLHLQVAKTLREELAAARALAPAPGGGEGPPVEVPPPGTTFMGVPIVPHGGAVPPATAAGEAAGELLAGAKDRAECLSVGGHFPNDRGVCTRCGSSFGDVPAREERET